MIDVVGAGFVQATERIVRERGEVNDGVEAAKIRRLDVADVLANRRHSGQVGAEVAALVEIGVEPGDVVAGRAGGRSIMTEPM